MLQETTYPDYALFGFSNKFAFELFGHLRVEELGESSLYGQGSLPVPLLHLVTELVPVVELFDFIKVGLISGVSEESQERRDQNSKCRSAHKDMIQTKTEVPRHKTQGSYPTFESSPRLVKCFLQMLKI